MIYVNHVIFRQLILIHNIKNNFPIACQFKVMLAMTTVTESQSLFCFYIAMIAYEYLNYPNDTPKDHPVKFSKTLQKTYMHQFQMKNPKQPRASKLLQCSSCSDYVCRPTYRFFYFRFFSLSILIFNCDLFSRKHLCR
jgi:hypothetical protein